MVTPCLRPASSVDAAVLTALMKASSAYSGEYAGLLADYRLTEEQIHRDHIIIAEAAEKILGFYSLIAEPEPELDLLFVADTAQRLGIGRLLIEDMVRVAAARGFSHIKIVSHPPSLGFYLRQGAQQVGVKPPSGRALWPRPILILPIPVPPGATR